MRWLHGLMVLFLFSGVAYSQEDLGGCLEAGIETGRNNTKQFCETLRARDRGGFRTVSGAYSVPVQFCSLAIADSCRTSMHSALRRDRWCYNEVVSHSGLASIDEFNRLVEAGCPRPKIVRCPFRNARVHKGFWCKEPFRSAYWAHIDGVWWRFIRNEGGQGDEKRYLVQASDGAVRVATRFDLTIVTNR